MKEFISSDFNTISTLTYFWQQVINTNKSDSWRIKFTFSDNQRLREIVDKYYKKQLSVEPLTYFMNQKTLKQRLYQFKKWD